MAGTVVATPGSSFSELTSDDLMAVDGGCCLLLISCLISLCNIKVSCSPKQSCAPKPSCTPSCTPSGNICIQNGSTISF